MSRWAMTVFVLSFVVVCGCALALGSALLTVPLDRPSYAAGWSYVVNRQPDGRGAASPEFRTDDGIRAACARYADGFAQLDGVRDADDFLAGCADAAELTRFEPAGVR